MEIDERMNAICINTLSMFDITIQYLDEAIDVYLNSSVMRTPKIDDNKVDHLERSIEEECLNLILKERPFSKDLRKVTGIFKMVEDIERLGDHAEDLFWSISNLLKYSQGIRIDSLIEEAKVAMSMVKDSYVAFVKGDVKLAEEICKRDDVVDALYLQSLKEIPHLKDQYHLNDDFILYSTLLSKYLERVADHASNIAEWVNYIETGYYKDEIII
ncbi:MAG: phosphate signaling complex protein PhoU [Mollicutes bacterium]|nr:phosphate signaling complex protein PhoU [Mollicutes bacterium]MDD7043505.1 phosphate signaling complex protein PhoU [Mollicutes bacterium]MDY6069876.1 phosphate signaling complex protein PhoU [Bacilli bacterium]